MNFIVTVCRTKRNPDHDPTNKKTGRCEWSEHCTDVTGQHHSFIMYSANEEIIRSLMGARPGWRLTRLERVDS